MWGGDIGVFYFCCCKISFMAHFKKLFITEIVIDIKKVQAGPNKYCTVQCTYVLEN